MPWSLTHQCLWASFSMRRCIWGHMLKVRLFPVRNGSSPSTGLSISRTSQASPSSTVGGPGWYIATGERDVMPQFAVKIFNCKMQLDSAW